MIRLFVLMIFLCLQFVLKAENPSMNYISQYKEIAVAEMQRTGIPASIKMAQALLESGAGSSTLARKANNHFGIKCGGSWTGDTFYREDDDYKNGKLINSCFRKFDSVHESFMAHSDFLTKQNRYAFLFDYDREDYKAWAKGLRKAGYATDKSYSQKLISIIEKYELHLLDQIGTIFEEEEQLADNSTADQANDEVLANNDVEIVRVEAPYESPEKRSRVKRPGYYRKANIHIMEEGQTLAEIAVIYGIDESSLRLRNRIPKDAEPIEGEKINLRKKISLLNRPQFERFVDNAVAAVNAEFIF